MGNEQNIQPTFVNNEGIVPSTDYQKWLKSLKARYRSAQAKAAVRVNEGMLRFYWSLGRDIVNMKVEKQWGKGIIKKLSLDMKSTFPNQTGFSVTNLKYIKRWFNFYSEEIRHQVGDDFEDTPLFDQVGQKISSIRHQAGAEIEMPEKFTLVPWRHHIEIFTKCHSVKEALFYIDKR